MSNAPRIFLLTLAALFTFLAPLDARGEGVDAGTLAGHWTGQGRLLDVELQKKHGPVAIDLSIAPDLTLTGTVGGATIRPAKGGRNGRRIDFQVLLTGQVRTGPDFEKDHLVLLVTRADDTTASIDFHIKTNFTLDLTMRQGVAELKRTP
jgi:hypothetical protein